MLLRNSAAPCEQNARYAEKLSAQDRLYYTGYSGSMEECTAYIFILGTLPGWETDHPYSGAACEDDAGCVRHPFQISLHQNTLDPRTFPPEQALLQFLRHQMLSNDADSHTLTGTGGEHNV